MKHLIAPLLIVSAFLIGAQAAPAPRIGVVDLNQIFEGHSKKAELEKELGTLKDEFEAKIKNINVQVEELRAELELLQKGTSRYEEIEDQSLALLQKRARIQRKAAEQFQSKKLGLHDLLLKEIDVAIAEFAEEQGYTAIFQREFSLPKETLSWRAVLYHAPQTDVTATILARINETAAKK